MKFAILDPRNIQAAQAANDAIFALGPVLGIEVTVPALASRCEWNIDPQHSGGNTSRAAIEEARDGYNHHVAVRRDGIKQTVPEVIVTVRADLDSVGAMAVYAMRAECYDSFGYGMDFSPEAYERIRLVAESDRFAHGEWPGPRPLPTEEALFDDSSASAESDTRLAPMAAAVSDFKVPLEQRVEWMRCWIATGHEPEGYRERWLAERKAIAKAVADGTTKTEKRGRIAVVISTHRAATAIGYCLSPIVVALNPEFRFQGGEPHRKFTICQYQEGYTKLLAVKVKLSELEPGWGGSPTIVGSPQGVNSMLTIEQIVEIVELHTGGGFCYSCGRWPLKREQWGSGDWERCDFCGAGLA